MGLLASSGADGKLVGGKMLIFLGKFLGNLQNHKFEYHIQPGLSMK
jgi:hypothetical protein